ncbi:hypothetical protein HYPSUDRAFT_1070303, partial [Hypholoma sublateritium FD-334 SS-4]
VNQRKDILDRTYALLTDFNHGVPPKGSVAPWWETSKEGTDILLDKGIEYGVFLRRIMLRAPHSIFFVDHSSMAHKYDFLYAQLLAYYTLLTFCKLSGILYADSSSTHHRPWAPVRPSMLAWATFLAFRPMRHPRTAQWRLPVSRPPTHPRRRRHSRRRRPRYGYFRRIRLPSAPAKPTHPRALFALRSPT